MDHCKGPFASAGSLLRSLRGFQIKADIQMLQI